MKTTAMIKTDTSGYLYVQVRTSKDHYDNPILMQGYVYYDNVALIPEFIKPTVKKLLIECKRLNNPLDK